VGRIRTIKPEMAKHEGLYDLELETSLPIRFAWAILPTACDRDGRFKWLPRTLKADILPHDPVDFSRVLDAWLTRGYVVKYRVKNEWFGLVCTFRKHQVVNTREGASSLPSIEEAEEVIDHRNHKVTDASSTRAARVDETDMHEHVHARGEGKGKEGKGKEGNIDLALSPSDSPPSFALTFTLNDKTEFGITSEHLQTFRETYPGIDVLAELRKIRTWCMAKPANRKTRKGALAFVNNWLSRAQDKGVRPNGYAPPEDRPRTARRLGSDQ
jgi:hypothetical protein